MCDVCETNDGLDLPIMGQVRAVEWTGDINSVQVVGLQREDGVVEYGVYVRFNDSEGVGGATMVVIGDTLMNCYGGEDVSEVVQRQLDERKES